MTAADAPTATLPAVPAPTVGPAPAGQPWTWTATDLLILPVALWLAEGPGTRRRTRNAVTRRGVSYRPGSTR